MKADGKQLDMTRQFDAPVQALYQLCASPAFFKVCGAETRMGLFEFQVGGRYDYRIGDNDYIRGEFTEIVPFEKIAFTWTTNTPFGECKDTLVTLTLTGKGERSELRIVHSGFASDKIHKCHDEGWDDAFQSIARRFKDELALFQSDQLKIRFKVSETIQKPVSEVFAAFIAPELIKSFFVKDTTGPLVAGTTVEWSFSSLPMPCKVRCTEVVKNHSIRFSWNETRVAFAFESLGDAECKLTIRCEGWGMNQASLDDSYEECEGWRHVLCLLKAKIQYGIDL